jgi:alanine dehydrogenase
MDTPTPAVPWFDGSELQRRLPYPAVVEALKKAFSPGIEAPARHMHAVPSATVDAHDHSVLLIMPAWRPDSILGVKLTTHFSAQRRGGQPISSLYIVFDAVAGRPLAMLDGAMLTNIRTASICALAGNYLARPDSRVLLLAGTGALAPHIARAYAAVRPIEKVLVWGKRPEAAAKTASLLCAHALNAEPVTSIEAGLRSADIVACATASREPLVRFSQTRPGTHVDLVGGFTPEMREVDDELVAHARVVLENFSSVSRTAGDIVGPLQSGAITEAHIRTELKDVIAGSAPGRRAEKEITLFKSVGDAREDLCAAELLLTTLGGG